MIKFVLHGGIIKPRNKDNNSFYQELTSGFRGRVNILINCFARDNSVVEEKFKRHVKRFLSNSLNKNLKFVLAEKDKFSEQVKDADIVYFDGGDTDKLIGELSLMKNFEKLLDGKVIGGLSAGVYCLAKYYYGNDIRKIGKGLGILPIKAYCHFEAKDIDVVKKLTTYNEELPVFVLPNYKWVVIYK